MDELDFFDELLESFDPSALASLADTPAAVDDTPAAVDDTPAAVDDTPASSDTAAVAANPDTKGAADDLQAVADTLPREDLVWLCRAARLAKAASAAWKASLSELRAEVGAALSDIPSAPELLGRLAAQREAREAHAGLTMAALREQLRARGTAAGAANRAGLVDLLLDDAPAEMEFKLDPDQAAVLARRHAPRLYISAGPGAGKTGTLCHLVCALQRDAAESRTLVLVFNRKAEAIFARRLKLLGGARIANARLTDRAVSGAAVLTFDKLAHQVNGGFQTEGLFEGGLDATTASYRRAMEKAVAGVVKWAAAHPGLFGVIVIDEAQDVTDSHAALVEAVIDGTGGMVVAGDPRQEVSNGRWFSERWAIAPEAEKALLRYNHRSAPEIVAVLNAYSRACFPSLHHDQIAARPAGGRAELVTVAAPPGWFRDRTRLAAAAAALGDAAGALVAAGPPTSTFAIAPVSTQKFGLEATTMGIRQLIHDAHPGTRVVSHAADGGLGAPGALDGDFIIGTSRVLKGAERPRVVVIGADLDYGAVLGPGATAKLCFVAMSRARDELFVLLRPTYPETLTSRLAPLAALAAGAAPAPVRALAGNFRRRSVPVTGGDACEAGLSALESIGVRVLATFEAPRLSLEVRNDADFVGCFAEALLAEALGFKLAGSVEVRAGSATALCCTRGGYVLEIGADEGGQAAARAAARAETVGEMLRVVAADLGGAPPAYRHAALMFAAAAQRPWTVSSRNATVTADASACAAWLCRVLGAPPDAYQRGGSYPVSYSRSARSEPSALVAYGIDLSTNDMVVEIKHAAALTAMHRRQAAIYACIANTSEALLVNLLTGVAERVAAADRTEVECSARAMVTIQHARKTALGSLAATAIQPPAAVRRQPCVIAVDIEADAAGHLTEIAAVAVTVADWQPIGVFSRVAPGVRECAPASAPAPGRRPAQPGSPSAIEQMTGLAVDSPALLAASQDAFIAEFRNWVEAKTAARAFLHWGGNESKLVGSLGDAHDVLHGSFRPWLSAAGRPRVAGVRLCDAAAQLLPGWDFEFHRAFEDALATLAVFIATTTFEGVC